MKKCSFLLAITLLLSVSLLTAEDESKKTYPPVGMEIIKVGDAETLVPKGTRIRKEGDLNVVEDISEYSARKFVDIQERFGHMKAEYESLKNETRENLERLKSRQEVMEKELKRLKNAFEEIKKTAGRKP